MAAKEITVKRYVVRLSADERERLEALIRKGKSPARRLLKARILLKADVSEAGEGWSDSRIIKALGAVAGLVGNEGGVVSEVINLESSGVEAPDRRPRHDEHYHEA